MAGFDGPEAVGALKRFGFVDFSYRLSRCRIVERVIYAHATCLHNDPLYTDKVSKFAKAGQWKALNGRGLRGIDSVKMASNLGDFGCDSVMPNEFVFELWRRFRFVQVQDVTILAKLGPFHPFTSITRAVLTDSKFIGHKNRVQNDCEVPVLLAKHQNRLQNRTGTLRSVLTD